jgi:hypothetical protein
MFRTAGREVVGHKLKGRGVNDGGCGKSESGSEFWTVFTAVWTNP